MADLIAKLGLNSKEFDTSINTSKKELQQFQRDIKRTSDALISMKLAGKEDTDEYKQLTASLMESKAALANAQKAVQSLGRATDATANSTESLRQKIMEGTNALAQMQLEGKAGTAEYIEMAQEIGKLKDAYNDASKAVSAFSNDTKAITALSDVMQLAAGATGMLTSTLATFGMKSEEVVVIQKRLQAAIAAVNSAQAIAKALNKDSGLTHYINSIKLRIAAYKAEKIAVDNVTKSTIALRLAKLGVAAVAVGAAIAGITELIKHYRKQKEAVEDLNRAQQKLDDIIEGTANKVSKPIANLTLLAKAYRKLNSEAEKKKFISDYAKELKELTGQTVGLKEAESIFANNTSNFVSALEQRARAAATYDALVAAVNEQIKAKMRLEEEESKLATTSQFGTTTIGAGNFGVGQTVTTVTHQWVKQNKAVEQARAAYDAATTSVNRLADALEKIDLTEIITGVNSAGGKGENGGTNGNGGSGGDTFIPVTEFQDEVKKFRELVDKYSVAKRNLERDKLELGLDEEQVKKYQKNIDDIEKAVYQQGRKVGITNENIKKFLEEGIWQPEEFSKNAITAINRVNEALERLHAWPPDTEEYAKAKKDLKEAIADLSNYGFRAEYLKQKLSDDALVYFGVAEDRFELSISKPLADIEELKKQYRSYVDLQRQLQEDLYMQPEEYNKRVEQFLSNKIEELKDAIKLVPKGTEAYKELNASIMILQGYLDGSLLNEGETTSTYFLDQVLDKILNIENELEKTYNYKIQDNGILDYYNDYSAKLEKAKENLKLLRENADLSNEEIQKQITYLEKLVNVYERLLTENGFKLPTFDVDKVGDYTTAVGALGDAFSGLTKVVDRFSSSEDSALSKLTDFTATTLNTLSSTISQYVTLAAGKTLAEIPYPANLAAVATLIAGFLNIIGSLPKFATGGIVGGSSYSGDRVLASVNSGEMILNTTQQAKLFRMINSGQVEASEVNFKIKGTDLVGVMKNYNSLKSKVQ